MAKRPPTPLTRDRVVDLLRYRDARASTRPAAPRAQGQLDFDGQELKRPALALVTPFRPLTERGVEHRRRMLDYLQRQRTGGSSLTS